MYKKLRDGKIVSHPTVTRRTIFRVEGKIYPYYTIIDCVSIKRETFVLLENNELGEEDTIVVKIRNRLYLLLTEHDPFCPYSVFIPAGDIVTETWDDIATTLIDQYDDVDEKDIIYWPDEEIDKCVIETQKTVIKETVENAKKL